MLKPKQNSLTFAKDFFRCVFLIKNVCFRITIKLTCILLGHINDMSPNRRQNIFYADDAYMQRRIYRSLSVTVSWEQYHCRTCLIRKKNGNFHMELCGFILRIYMEILTINRDIITTWKMSKDKSLKLIYGHFPSNIPHSDIFGREG